MATTEIDITTVDGRPVTLKLNDNLPFGALKSALERTMDVRDLMRMDRKQLLSGDIKINGIAWIENILARAIVAPVKYRNISTLYDVISTDDIQPLMVYVNDKYPIGKVIGTLGHAFGVSGDMENKLGKPNAKPE